MKDALRKLQSRATAYSVALARLRTKWSEHGLVGKNPYESLRARFYRELWRATASLIGAQVEDLGEEFLRIRRGKEFTIVNRFDVQLDSRLALRIAGHKPISYRLLRELGAPVVPHHAYGLSQLDDAWGWARERTGAGRSVVVKPALGSAGRGVTTGIRTRTALRRASIRAAAVSARLLLEEELEGESFRLLYLRGELLDAIVRRRPTVVGDGRSSIGALVAAESAARLQGTIRALHPLVVDEEMHGFLRSSGQTVASVPASGASVDVKRVVNQNTSRDNESILGVPHASTVELGRRIVASLGLELASVDLLTTDVSRPLSETGGVVNEVNTTPGLHHHYLVANPGRAPARDVLELLLIRSGERP